MKEGMIMEIRLLCDKDFIIYKNSIANLLEQNYRISFPKIDFESNYFYEKTLKMFDYYKQDKARIFLCIDGTLCGFVWICENFYMNEKRLHINELVVDEKYRNLGIGTKLINKVFEFAKQNKISKVDLYVTADNCNAVEFYKRKGFEIERYMMSVNMKDI